MSRWQSEPCLVRGSGPRPPREARRASAALGILASVALHGCIGPEATTIPEEHQTFPGSVRVAVNTTGANPDPDGYDLTIDEGTAQTVAAVGSVTFSGLSAGVYQVALSGAAGNCTVVSSNPQSFTIVAATTVDVFFEVACP